jgi:VanZ family protein
LSLRRFERPRLWLSLAWSIVTVIVVLSLIPPLHLEPYGAPTWNDKVGHFLAYFALGAWYAQLYDGASDMRRRLLFCLLLGAAMEGLQSLTATRSADWRDMLANAAGVLCGGATWLTPMATALQRWDRRYSSDTELL